MSYIRIWVYCVWATKRREPILTNEFRPVLFNHIIENAKKKDIYIDSINGYKEHVHCIISLKRQQTIDKAMQLIKGESSFWINKKYGKLTTKLNWQEEYFAVSFGESQLGMMRGYLNKQEEHHKKKSFQEEVDEFMVRYNYARLKDS